ncbi:MAG: alpha/beta hydrolase domain-containing protein [Hyphomonadaceae bacterium]|nr:alpha/beta hydrolase domain-containing protein [Hyphomonadaceae bacterium]
MKMSRRTLLATTGAAISCETLAARAASAKPQRKTVTPSRLARPSAVDVKPFMPRGQYRVNVAEAGYVEEEWFASGTDDTGQDYVTLISVMRPKDAARFSGVVLVEPFHGAGIAPICLYTSPYITRSGHGWACVVSQKTALEAHVQKSNPEHYASLNIQPATASSGPVPGAAPPASNGPIAARVAASERANQASNAILAQTGAALRTSGPFEGWNVRKVILMGHSGTGYVCTNYIANAHGTHRLAGGAPVFDGLFPSGYPGEAFGPRDVPLLQVMCDGDAPDATTAMAGGFGVAGRRYRRRDSDAPDDRYRLYEIAGMPHMGTRYPPYTDPRHWQSMETAGRVPLDSTMNSLPHHEMFEMALAHLVDWVNVSRVPPRAPRMQLDQAGRYFAKDAHGNTVGGIRCVQMDVPRATYYACPRKEDGSAGVGTVGTEVQFEVAKMRRLYGTPANYQRQFNERLDRLISQGWFLKENAEAMRAEAKAQQF